MRRTDISDEQERLIRAKHKFAEAIDSVTPSEIVRNNPKRSLLIAVGTGLTCAVAGLKMIGQMARNTGTVLKVINDIRKNR